MKPTPPPVTKVPRRKPGRGSQVTPAERREIQRLHLAEGLNQRQLAVRTGRTRKTTANQLKGEDFELAATWTSVSHAMVWRKSGRQRVERHLDVLHPPTLEVEHHS